MQQCRAAIKLAVNFKIVKHDINMARMAVVARTRSAKVGISFVVKQHRLLSSLLLLNPDAQA